MTYNRRALDAKIIIVIILIIVKIVIKNKTNGDGDDELDNVKKEGG